MNELQIFNNPKFGQVRMVEIEKKSYAVGVDVARMLEYAKPSQAVIDHCKGIRKLGIPSYNQHGVMVMQETNVIPEGDIYRLIVKAADQSKNPGIKAKAESVEKWIFDEVLPSIRKHGLYAVDEVLSNPDMLIKALQELKTEREAHKNTITLLEAKTLQLDESKEWFTIKRVAKLNNRDWRDFNWKILKNTSDYLGYPVRKIFDANYGNVNAYHIEVWKHEYSGYKFS